jgi:NAD(P)-dependent dehydrogenase (short-subunit alcohol dehydrogenase family)
VSSTTTGRPDTQPKRSRLFAGRVAIVTGASRGIGAPTARTFAGDLLLAARTGQQLVDHLIRDPLTVTSPDHRPQSGAINGVIPSCSLGSDRCFAGFAGLKLRSSATATKVSGWRSSIQQVLDALLVAGLGEGHEAALNGQRRARCG